MTFKIETKLDTTQQLQIDKNAKKQFQKISKIQKFQNFKKNKNSEKDFSKNFFSNF